MKKVNAFDQESLSMPSYEVIIERLKEVAKTESDAALSKWLGKTSTFIATCRNRGGINIEVAIPKLSDDQLVYVLRGRRIETGKQAHPPPLMLGALQSLLDSPLEILADQVGARPSDFEQWASGKSEPDVHQLGNLFNILAIASLSRSAVTRSLSQSDPAGKGIPLQGNAH